MEIQNWVNSCSTELSDHWKQILEYCLLQSALARVQGVFLAGGVWPQHHVPLRNAIIGVACAQTLVPFRNTITQATAVHMAANGRSSAFAIRK